MDLHLDVSAFIYFASVALGIVSGFILFIYGLKYSKANLLLGIGYLFLCIGMFVGLSLVSGLIQFFPFIYRWGNFFGLLFVPCPFLYTYFSTHSRQWKWYDGLHLLPAIFYFIDFSHVLFLSSAQKWVLIQSEIADLNVYAQFNQSRWLPSGVHLLMRTGLFGIYWLAQVFLLARWCKSSNYKIPGYDRTWWKWMLGFIGIQSIMFLPFFIGLFWKRPGASFLLAHATAAVFLYITSFLLFFFPSVLYGKKGAPANSDKSIRTKKAAFLSATTRDLEKMEELAALINKSLDEQCGFLTLGYSIHQFALSLNIPAYQVSNCLNQYMKISFIDLINQKRIHYCTLQLKQGNFDHYTLEAIAEKCGFNNRNSFATAFKKVMGISPSVFRSTLQPRH